MISIYIYNLDEQGLTDLGCFADLFSKDYPGELYDNDYEDEEFPAACLETPGDGGICKAKSTRWTFIRYGNNKRDSRTCEQFNYGGCGGNSNRFDTKQICENVCKHQNTTKSKQSGSPPASIHSFGGG